MKKLEAAVCSVFFIGTLSMRAHAGETQTDVWYTKAWDAIDAETAGLLNAIGINGSSDVSDFLSLSPTDVFSAFSELFRTSSADLTKDFLLIIAILLAVCLLNALAGNGACSRAAADTGILAAAFVMIAVNADIFTSCRAAIELSKDLMLSLIPVLTGIVAFSGQPSLAASFHTVVFAFAENISVLFCNVLPAVSAAGSALGAASAVSPLNKYSELSRLLSKAVNFAAAFIAGIFVAVLSVRGVIAGAADTVTIKGLRFLIGSSVPVVGSAVGEALNSVIAGMGLVRSSVLILGIVAQTLIALPALIKLALWSFLLYCISLLSDMLSLKRVAELTTAVRAVVSVLIAVTFFNAFVYIISCAILVTLEK